MQGPTACVVYVCGTLRNAHPCCLLVFKRLQPAAGSKARRNAQHPCRHCCMCSGTASILLLKEQEHVLSQALECWSQPAKHPNQPLPCAFNCFPDQMSHHLLDRGSTRGLLTHEGHDLPDWLWQGLVLLLDCADSWAQHINVQLDSKAFREVWRLPCLRRCL